MGTTTLAKIRVGQVVTGRALVSRYDRYAESVLTATDDYLKEMPRQRGKAAAYKVLAELPDAGAYGELRDRHYTMAVGVLVDDAYAELAALGEEVREIHDGLPEGLNQTDRAERLDQAASTCEGFDAPKVPESVAGITLVFFPDDGHRTGRNHRAGECGRMLREAAERLDDVRTMIVELRKCLKLDVATEGFLARIQDDADELSGTLETDAGDVESLDFPGMYG